MSRVGRFIGMAAADVVHFFRGRQAVPCTVQWVELTPEQERNLADWYAAEECCGGTCENGCWS